MPVPQYVLCIVYVMSEGCVSYKTSLSSILGPWVVSMRAVVMPDAIHVSDRLLAKNTRENESKRKTHVVASWKKSPAMLLPQ